MPTQHTSSPPYVGVDGQPLALEGFVLQLVERALHEGLHHEDLGGRRPKVCDRLPEELQFRGLERRRRRETTAAIILNVFGTYRCLLEAERARKNETDLEPRECKIGNDQFETDLILYP